jgi:hypothetical protein
VSDNLLPAFSKLVAAAEGLPEVVEATSYGTPALKVRKKLLCRVKDADTVVVMCPLEEKELLIEAAPEFYFETDHYRGWPAILVRVHAIPADELRLRLSRAWRMHAPKSLQKAQERR